MSDLSASCLSSNIFKITATCIHSPSSSLLGIYPTDVLTHVHSDLFASFVIAASLVVAEGNLMSINRGPVTNGSLSELGNTVQP